MNGDCIYLFCDKKFSWYPCTQANYLAIKCLTKYLGAVAILIYCCKFVVYMTFFFFKLQLVDSHQLDCGIKSRVWSYLLKGSMGLRSFVQGEEDSCLRELVHYSYFLFHFFSSWMNSEGFAAHCSWSIEALIIIAFNFFFLFSDYSE